MKMIKMTVEEALLVNDETWELKIKYDRSWILKRISLPEETLTSRIAEACNDIYLNELQRLLGCNLSVRIICTVFFFQKCTKFY